MGRYIRIRDNVNLYYESSGEGIPIIFIPGWSMSTEFFTKQLTLFSESREWRAIAYDPRSQGMSSKTDDGNYYSERGHDLKALTDALELRDVVLAGWSNGCYDAYSYVRHYGTDNVKAFISIDMSPVGFGSGENAWTSCSDIGELTPWYAPTVEKRVEKIPYILEWMLNRKPTEEESSWMREEILKTPLNAANLTLLDSLLLDFTREAGLLSEQIPFMHFLRNEWSERAVSWIHNVTPNASYVIFDNHMMFWTYPNEFNRVLMDFLR